MLTGKHVKEEIASGKIRDIIEGCIRLDVNERFSSEKLLEELRDYSG